MQVVQQLYLNLALLIISAGEVIWKIESITQLCITQQTSLLARVKYNGTIVCSTACGHVILLWFEWNK